MTSEWPGPAWLDCQGQEAGDGKVRCTIQVLGGGTHEVVVPQESFDPQGKRLKVRVIRPSTPQNPDAPMMECPSMETASAGFVVDCPAAEGETNGRVNVLAAYLEPSFDF